MHAYFWDPVRLLKELPDYDGGQIQIESTEKYGNSLTVKVFRGRIKRCFVDIRPGKKEIYISFDWLCYKDFQIKGEENEIERFTLASKKQWSVLPSEQGITVRYTTYYFQRDEDRVKMWTSLGEIIHFYKIGDHTNLIIDCNGKFTPYQVVNYKKLLLSLCYIIVINSKKNKK
jgi:hypothetical protein